MYYIQDIVHISSHIYIIYKVPVYYITIVLLLEEVLGYCSNSTSTVVTVLVLQYWDTVTTVPVLLLQYQYCSNSTGTGTVVTVLVLVLQYWDTVVTVPVLQYWDTYWIPVRL